MGRNYNIYDKMPTDNSSFTLAVDDDLREKMYRHVLGDDFSENDIRDGFCIEWDDIDRPEEESIGNAKQGFIAEAALSQLFEQAGIEHKWDGSEGADDLVVHGKTIDVKTRASKCEYRNLIKDYCMSNSDTVDFYFLCNVHYHPVDRNRITAVEFLGYISNEEFEQVCQPVKLYDHYESKKAECTPNQLKPIEDFINIAQMF
ncbi:hypothetical protein LC1Hm_1038 [Halomicrobium sp. LC1Hm]|nr:hypothetical protein LC1Hm_1038 [Halomicrobium sp. LC1Hm]